MLTSRIKTVRTIVSEIILLQTVLLPVLVVGLLYLRTANMVISFILPVLVYAIVYIIISDVIQSAIWLRSNRIEKGIKYSINHYLLLRLVRISLLDAGYYVRRQFFGIDVAKLPKIYIEFSDNYAYGLIKIENKIRYEQRLDNIELSSSLGKYIVETSYLSPDENYYCFDFFNSNINRQLRFDSNEELLQYSNNLDDNMLFIDSLSQVPLHHTLIVGQTGSGKTYALYSLILQMINKKINYHLYVADPKGSSLAVIGEKISPNNTFENVDDIIQSLREFNHEMDERKHRIKEKLLTKIDSSYVDFGLEPYVFIFDEYASFQSVIQSKDKKTRDEVNKLISQIVLQGRQLGFFLFVVMQKSDSSSLPTMIRDNLPLKIVLGNAEEQTYVTAFGYSKDIPNYKFNIGEGVFTFPQVANNPKICAFSYLNFNILDALEKSGGNVITPTPLKNN
ncbi:hypothetical protein AKUH3B202X_11180 [Apilactobacillus kunkeei]|nr:hypothetical protein AKUH3B202X_11180 [Apilactobacillus kunkeei]